MIYFTTPSLRFLICKLGKIIVSVVRIKRKKCTLKRIVIDSRDFMRIKRDYVILGNSWPIVCIQWILDLIIIVVIIVTVAIFILSRQRGVLKFKISVDKLQAYDWELTVNQYVCMYLSIYTYILRVNVGCHFKYLVLNQIFGELILIP